MPALPFLLTSVSSLFKFSLLCPSFPSPPRTSPLFLCALWNTCSLCNKLTSLHYLFSHQTPLIYLLLLKHLRKYLSKQNWGGVGFHLQYDHWTLFKFFLNLRLLDWCLLPSQLLCLSTVVSQYLHHFNPFIVYSATDHSCGKLSPLTFPDLTTSVNYSSLSSSLDTFAPLTTHKFKPNNLGKRTTPKISRKIVMLLNYYSVIINPCKTSPHIKCPPK